MIRNLKVLGLALVAIFAMSAMVASAASAASFTSGASTTTITGEDDNKVELFVTGTGITCTEVKYHAHVTGTSVPSVTANPSYKACKTSLGTEAKVTGFGDHGEAEADQCDFLIKADGKADLECPTGKEVTVDAASCTVHIPTQTNLGTITYTTDVRPSGKHDLTLHLIIGNITANHTDGAFCPLTGSGHAATAELLGTVTVWGVDPITGQDVDVTWDA